MNVHDWHRNGLKPAFATVEQWISDQLGFIGVEDEACFAIELRPPEDRAGLAVRILVVTEKGLLDMTWERPDDVERRHLTSRHFRWTDVQQVHLRSETRLDPRTLIHLEPEWALEIGQPELLVEHTEEGVALLEFWKALDKQLSKASR